MATLDSSEVFVLAYSGGLPLTMFGGWLLTLGGRGSDFCNLVTVAKKFRFSLVVLYFYLF